MNWWDLKARFYRWARKPWPLSALLRREQTLLRSLLDQCSPKSGLALDLGCGTGDSTALIGGRFRLFAADFSLAMLRQNGYARDRRFVADALFLPVKPAGFDLILCVGLSEYIEELGRLSRELNAVLKDNGKLILTSSPVNLFGLARNIGGSRLFLRDAGQVSGVFRRTGFSLIERGHIFSMDVYLFSKSGTFQ